MNLIIRRSDKDKGNLFPDSSISKDVVEKKVFTVFTTNIADYEFGPVIGKSSFLSTFIFAGKYSKTNEYVAIKKYDVDIMTVDEIKFLQGETNILNQLKHENIVTALTSFVVGTEVVLIFPLMEYRSCADIITKHFHAGLPEIVIPMILKDVLTGLGFIHERGVIHRAIKASHILISSDGCAKISGFRNSYQRCAKVQPKSDKVFQFPPYSTSNLKWLSPDVLQQNCNGYDEKSDIYSLGVTVCELVNGFVPYFDMKLSTMLLQKINGGCPFIFDASTLDKLRDTPDQELVNVFTNYFSNRQVSKQLHEFKDLCCIKNAEERPDTDTLLLHSLFIKMDRKRKSFNELILPAVPITGKCFASELKNCETKTSSSSSTFDWEF